MADGDVDRIVARCTSLLDQRLATVNASKLTLSELADLASIARSASGIRVRRAPEGDDYEALLERARKNPELMKALGLG